MHQLLKQMKEEAGAISSLYGLFTVRPLEKIICLPTLIDFGTIKADGAGEEQTKGHKRTLK